MIVRIVVYYVLAFFFTFLIGGIQQAAGLPAEAGIPQFGPALGALAMLMIFRKDGLKLNFSTRKIDSQAAAMTVLIPLGAAVIIFELVALLVGGNQFPPTVATLLIVWMPLGGLGEEIGWRGYFHRMLGDRRAGWLSTLIVGALWALWHVHLYQNGALYMIFVVLLMVSYSAVLYVIMRRTGFNVWLAALFHLLINLTNLMYFSVINETGFMIVNALVWAAIAGVIVARNREAFLGAPAA